MDNPEEQETSYWNQAVSEQQEIQSTNKELLTGQVLVLSTAQLVLATFARMSSCRKEMKKKKTHKEASKLKLH